MRPKFQRLRWLAAVAVLLTGMASSAWGASPKKTRVAVLDVKCSGGVDLKAVEGLSSLISSEAAGRRDLQVTNGADLSAALGFDRQKRMLGCSDTSCLAEIAGALGVDFLLYSEVSKVGKTFLLSMSLLDAASAKARGRLTRKATSLDALIDLAAASTLELLKEIPVAAAPPAAVASAAAPPSPQPPALTTAPVQAPPPEAAPAVTAAALSSSRGTWAWATGVGGGALLAGGAVLGVLALRKLDEEKLAGQEGRLDDYSRAKSSAQTLGRAGDILGAVGLVGLGTGIYLGLTGDAQPPLSLQLVPSRGGALASVQGAF